MGKMIDLSSDLLSRAKESVHNKTAMSEYIPIRHHITDNIIRLDNGQLMIGFSLRGFDYLTASARMKDQNHRRIEEFLSNIANKKITIYTTTTRRLSPPPAVNNYTAPFAQRLVHDYNRLRFGEALFSSQNTVFVLYDLFFFKGTKKRKPTQEEIETGITELGNIADIFIRAFNSVGAEQLGIEKRDNQLFSSLAESYAQLLYVQKEPMPVGWFDFNQLMSTSRMVFGFEHGEIREIDRTVYFGTISIKHYMNQLNSDSLVKLNNLSINFNLSQSFQYIETEAALRWMKLHRGRYDNTGDDAVSLRKEMDLAIDQIASGKKTAGLHNLVLTVFAPDLKSLSSLMSDCRNVLYQTGAKAVRDDLALPAQYLSQFPGNQSKSTRSAFILSDNFADFSPNYATPEGKKSGNHWGEYLAYSQTVTGSPYYFNLHSADVGHTLITGKTGAGKTVYEAVLMAHTVRDDINARVIIFDKDAGLWPFTLKMGGTYRRIRRGIKSGFNPFYLDYSAPYHGFLYELVLLMLGGQYDSDDKEKLYWAIGEIYRSYPDQPKERRLSKLYNLVPQSLDIAKDLRPWIEGGRNDWVFDNEVDELEMTDIWGIDVSSILDNDELCPSIMAYLFERVDLSLDGRPTVIDFQEFWQPLGHPYFAQRLDDWYRTARKREAVLIASTQQPTDALNADISAAVINQTATKIYLPNPDANESDYLKMKMTESEFEFFSNWPLDARKAYVKKDGGENIALDISMQGMDEMLFILSMNEERKNMLIDIEEGNGGAMPENWYELYLKKCNQEFPNET
jgi:type IV secretion system protein VirB4